MLISKELCKSEVEADNFDLLQTLADHLEATILQENRIPASGQAWIARLLSNDLKHFSENSSKKGTPSD